MRSRRSPFPPCAGTAIALAGVFGYSQVKRLTGKKKQA